MAKGFKCGSGGGVPLNFKVVGGTSAPSNPKENTIWINTDAEITGWFFSAAAPENPAAGMAWIQTGAISAVGMNALKKNGLMVYPLAAKQYVNGAWVEKVSKIYQGGAWADWWNGALYTSGNEYPTVTGGWYGKPWKVSGNSGPIAAETINIERTDSYIRMSFASGARRSGVLLTTKKIDLTNYNTLSFNGFISQNGYSNNFKANGDVFIFDSIGYDYYNGNSVKNATISNNGTAANNTINISDLSGEYYIGISLYNYDAASAFVQMNRMVLS